MERGDPKKEFKRKGRPNFKALRPLNGKGRKESTLNLMGRFGIS